MPPGVAHAPVCTCEIWLELAARPVSLIVTVKEPVPLMTWPVPVTPLPFSDIIAKLMVGVGEGAVVVVTVLPPPHATRTKRPAEGENQMPHARHLHLVRGDHTPLPAEVTS